MADASKQIRAIAKDDHNRAQNFKFRGIDAIYNGVHEALASNDIFCVPRVVRIIKEKEITTAKGGSGLHIVLEMEYAFFAPDGSSVTASTWGEGIDYGDKCINKCMSIAHKYALLQIFTIPTDDIEDPDTISHDVKQKNAKEIPSELEEKVNDTVRYFSGLGVSPRELELYVKKPLDTMTDQDFALLRSLATEIKMGAKPSEVINAAKVSARSKIENM